LTDYNAAIDQSYLIDDSIDTFELIRRLGGQACQATAEQSIFDHLQLIAGSAV
jgi:hypothetical protein